MKYKKETNKQLAFTLLEVLVTLSIIVVILTLSTISYRRSNSRNAIIMAAYQLAGDARLAESYASSARQYGDQPKWNVWGIYFNTANQNQYMIYADKNASGFYDGAVNDAIWRTIKLPANIIISDIKSKKGLAAPVSTPIISASYFPPSPTTSIAVDSLNTYDETTITLYDKINLSTKTVTLNFFGLIDVTK